MLESWLTLWFCCRSREEPTLISALSGKQIVQISCGSTYSAARTVNGELYSWGRGNYGRLGHGSTDDQCLPGLIKTLKGHRIVDVACGSGDAQTVAVSDTGTCGVTMAIHVYIKVWLSLFFWHHLLSNVDET